MRYGNSGLVFVISPSGTVAHRFALEVPSGALLKQIKVANHRIAALFEKEDTRAEVLATFVRTYDADSGKLLSDYVLDPSIPSLTATYDGDVGFTFIGPKVIDPEIGGAEQAGRLRIFQVGPR
jgi:hypothetical protein